MKKARAQVAGGTGEGTMTAIRMTSDRLTASSVPSGMIVRLLLASGVLSLIFYVATDILGGLRYPGYDFSSQAISELGAIGAPSAGLVGPLFFIYGVLVLAFAVGVYREGARRRELRITGAALIAYAVIGFASPFARMHHRGAGSLDTDRWHIVLTVALVALLLVAMGSAATALGRRFRIYSIATMGVVVAFGAWTGTYAARLAAGLPTPGMGIIERIDVYAAMLWTAVLSCALLRTRPHSSSGANHRIPESGNSSIPDSRFRIPGGFAARSDAAGAGMFARVPTAVTSDPE